MTYEPFKRKRKKAPNGEKFQKVVWTLSAEKYRQIFHLMYDCF